MGLLFMNLNNNIPDQLWLTFANQCISQEIKRDAASMETIKKAYDGGMVALYLFMTDCLTSLPDDIADQVISKMELDMKKLTEGCAINRGENMN